MKTKKEIIDETVAFYTTNPRSLKVGGDCLYLSPQGNKCAFSRCCTDEGVIELHKYNEGITVYYMDVDSFLKKEYQGHGSVFWAQIQGLHDSNGNWNGLNLTSTGKAEVHNLHERWDNV